MQGIVIQGPTLYWEKVIDCYKDLPNIVWSTWDDEPEENIKNISKYIPIIKNKKPEFPGYLNINLQCISTYAGVEYLRSLGVTEVLKTRGDINITNLPLLLDSLKGRELSYLAICKEGVRNDIRYDLVYTHTSHDYPTDQVLYGSIDAISNSFNFQVDGFEPIPPEALITYAYLTWRGEQFLLDYLYLKEKGITFYMEDCIKHNVKFHLVKEKYNFDLVETHNSKQYYNF